MTKAAAVVLGGSVLGHLGNYGFYLLAGRWLGPADFSALTALTALGMIILLPVSGYQSALARALSVALASPEGLRPGSLRTPSQIFAVIGVVGICLALLATPIACATWSVTPIVWLVAVLWIALTVTLQVGVGLCQGHNNFGTLAALLAGPYGILRPLFLAVPAVAAVTLVSALAALVLASVIGLAMVWRAIRLWFPRSVVKAQRSVSLRSGPTIVALLSVAVLTNIDVIVARALWPPAEAGVYAAAALVGKLAFHVPAALMLVVLPLASAQVAHQKTLAPLVLRSAAVTVVLGGSVAVVLWLVPTAWLVAVLGPQYSASSVWAPIIAAIMTGVALIYLHLNVAIARGLSSVWSGWWPLSILSVVLLSFFGQNVSALLGCLAGIVVGTLVCLEIRSGGFIRMGFHYRKG